MDEVSANQAADTAKADATTADATKADDPATAVLETLAAEQLRTLALFQALQSDFDLGVEAAASSNADDEHDPEGATLAFERAQVIFLQAQCRSRLDGIDRAIKRCEQGTYGTCEGCGEAIPAERLAARPTAQTCLGCAL